MRHIGYAYTNRHTGEAPGLGVRASGREKGLVDAEPAPHRPEGTVGPFREGCRERPAA
jgi:hypothetical protein